MAERGIYTAAERRMLEAFRDLSARLTGWVGETPAAGFPYPAHRVATKELIEHMASAADFRNPLYRDDAYARNTRWGSVVAPPFYYHAILHGGGICPLFLAPDEGIVRNELVLMMHKSDFYKPVHVGDVFKVWYGPTKIEDITESGENSLRRFRTSRLISYINQRDEIVCSDTDYHFYTILPPAGNRGAEKYSVKENNIQERIGLEYTKEYSYTKDDIGMIDRLYETEERRGSNALFWEDVAVGESLPPTVMGPLTAWDSVVSMQGFGAACLTMNDLRQLKADTVIVDPATGIPGQDIELHLTDRGARVFNSYSVTPIGPPILHFFGRLITNWMGDDGFLRRLTWRNMTNTPFGDTIFGRGKVTRKYIENGECMVDLDIWMESVRGFVSNVGPATVSLLSREKIFARNEAPAFVVPPLADAYERDVGSPCVNDRVDVKAGDRVRLKDRDDWPMPGGYRLARRTGTVTEVVDYPKGYALIEMDEAVTGIDTRVPLGFRLDAIEQFEKDA
ncbi:FAS1-like dehydratase domain-containing protein [Burkholderia diffusa]|uniref:FAS1-like dehydratase domain-containing protein n=1 Tax=Burkholderia diffusa TaxID=488732 RepID=UPI002ABD82A0|nr:MaoC family dehydratase N-terminal domain-containing protein [Burkholderia diffusa]